MQTVQIFTSVTTSKYKQAVHFWHVVGRVHVARSWRSVVRRSRPSHGFNVQHVHVTRSQWSTPQPTTNNVDVSLGKCSRVAVPSRWAVTLREEFFLFYIFNSTKKQKNKKNKNKKTSKRKRRKERRRSVRDVMMIVEIDWFEEEKQPERRRASKNVRGLQPLATLTC